jgi:phosphotriesterase-related protein
MTVCGPADPGDLGVTSMCDHVLYNGEGRYRRMGAGTLTGRPFPVDRGDRISLENVGILHRNTFLARDALVLDDEEAMARELALFRQAGGGAILDMSVAGSRLGDAAGLRRLSEQTGVLLVASTGLCLGDAWPDAPKNLGFDGYYDWMLGEVEQGLRGTDIKPGCVTLTLGGWSEDGKRALEAAARVGLETGLLLALRVMEAADIPEVLGILRETGADMGRVLISDVSCVDRPSFKDVIRDPSLYRVNTDGARRILDAGCAIGQNFPNTDGMELWGGYDAGDWAQMSGLVSLIDGGYCDQIVLGNDCRAKVMLHGFGGEGFCRMQYYTLPMLRDAAGISDYAIRRMSAENPARLLAY